MAGVDVVWAANHWPAAVAAATTHSCQDLHQVDWTAVPPHDLLLASPACQGHSRARGSDRPHHDASRASAWAVVAAEVHRPSSVLIENVPEFGSWVLFQPWCEALAALGYRLSLYLLDAADFGVPQHRRRLFIHGSLTASALEFPSNSISLGHKLNARARRGRLVATFEARRRR